MTNVERAKVFGALLEEAKAWCEKQSHGRWTYGIEKADKSQWPTYYNHTFRFKGKRDATLFKLTFG